MVQDFDDDFDDVFDHLDLQEEVEALEYARDIIAAQAGIVDLDDLEDYYSDDEDESNIPEESKTEDALVVNKHRRRQTVQMPLHTEIQQSYPIRRQPTERTRH